jgi:23S rRNA A2030 N6-methylase RlmJ
VTKAEHDRLVVKHLHSETDIKLKMHTIETQKVEIKQLKGYIKEIALST